MTHPPRVPLVQIDSFTTAAFGGNPAGVCILPDGFAATDAWMQAVAREMNVSATAFLRHRGEAWELRWFTRAVEIDLCGHATLASAHLLWEDGFLAGQDAASFDTRSGRLTCTRAVSGRIEMDFPAKRAARSESPPELLPALGVTDARFVGRNEFDFLVELEDDAAVRALDPDHRRLRTLPIRGVIVTAAAAPGADYDFVSRFFGSGVGIDEDPVTGSAHCALGPYWSEKLGRRELLGWQASPRGGRVHTRVEGERVVLGGTAVTVLRGELPAAALP